MHRRKVDRTARRMGDRCSVETSLAIHPARALGPDVSSTVLNHCGFMLSNQIWLLPVIFIVLIFIPSQWSRIATLALRVHFAWGSTSWDSPVSASIRGNLSGLTPSELAILVQSCPHVSPSKVLLARLPDVQLTIIPKQGNIGLEVACVYGAEFDLLAGPPGIAGILPPPMSSSSRSVLQSLLTTSPLCHSRVIVITSTLKTSLARAPMPISKPKQCTFTIIEHFCWNYSFSGLANLTPIICFN